jgi:hypothetical protein
MLEIRTEPADPKPTCLPVELVPGAFPRLAINHDCAVVGDDEWLQNGPLHRYSLRRQVASKWWGAEVHRVQRVRRQIAGTNFIQFTATVAVRM